MNAPDRLAELGRRHALDEVALRRLERLLALLAEPRAPTAVHEPAAAVDVHIADSLAALELPEVQRARRIADLGAGAGPPGIVLAIALAGARVALVESVARKVAFLERLGVELGLDDVEVVCERAESWRAGRGRHDLVTARALAPLAVLAEYAAPLLALGGVLVAWKGTVGPAESGAAARAARELGLTPAGVHPARPFAASRDRSLYVYRKSSATPERFPRRPGMARKRPLGS